MTRPEIDFATSSDDAGIRSLLRRESIPGLIRFTFEREPDFWLGCKVTGEDCRVLVARDPCSRETVGMACRSTRNVFVNGTARRLGYLGQLRIDSRFRGQWLVARGFSKLKLLHEADPLPAYLASIVEGNREAMGVLVQRRRRGFPAFHAVADFRTVAILIGRTKPAYRGDVTISAVRPNELASFVAFLNLHGPLRNFSPYWVVEDITCLSDFGLNVEDLRVARRAGQMVGVAGLWDQSRYKQTVVQDYSGWLKLAAPLYNKSAKWIGRSKLPSPGERLHCAFASPFCIANNDLHVCNALLRDLYNLAKDRGLFSLLVGFDCKDPLLAAKRSYRHILYPSRIYLAEWPDGVSIHEQLDNRPIYVDIATL
jgi:hypothetical protein